jgi:hypothetical protein
MTPAPHKLGGRQGGTQPPAIITSEMKMTRQLYKKTKYHLRLEIILKRWSSAHAIGPGPPSFSKIFFPPWSISPAMLNCPHPRPLNPSPPHPSSPPSKNESTLFLRPILSRVDRCEAIVTGAVNIPKVCMPFSGVFWKSTTEVRPRQRPAPCPQIGGPPIASTNSSLGTKRAKGRE